MRSFARWSRALGRARPMVRAAATAGRPRFVVEPPRFPEHKPQVRWLPWEPRKREPGEPLPRWRQVLRDLNSEELDRIPSYGMDFEELDELSGRIKWALTMEDKWLDDPKDSILDPAFETRRAQLLDAYFRVLDELAVVEGREAPSSLDRRLLYDLDHAKDKFLEAYQDRLDKAFALEREQGNNAGRLVIYARLCNEVLEEVIGEYKQRIAAAKAKQRGSQAVSC